ncbi:MAG: flagellar biosynthetic protein FliO [Ignavibacteriae bacterium HGW-Ignavibacteriae-2]|jgi:flagellar protein FliO/FliZ|nr:flagellar biosynthetic protein FliO [Bacteroidota bacterium]PKL89265.1 MAG: flagellar biosynthetic protein FliO [Ignavibacteriae bacterium HGW-Ignavibacteriae-2]
MSFFELLKAFIPLILILGLLYGVLYLVKRKGFRINPTQSKINGVEILSTQTIMPKKFISLIKVKDKIILVGITDNNISLLKEFDYDEEFSEQQKVDKQNFSDIFKKNLGIR